MSSSGATWARVQRCSPEAILADRLGFNPDPPVTARFAREVIARLGPEFELTALEVDGWIARRLAGGCWPGATRTALD